MANDHPYAERYGVNRRIPETGRPRKEVLAELRAMATEEDRSWESGKCSGTMYCGDHEHYGFLNEAFGLYAHVNALQRDICPSQTRFEGEIIAMTLDMLHADAVTDGEPVGIVTTGGTGSILHALLAYRDHAAATRGVERPNFVKPETGHPAFDKGCHLFGIELRTAPIDPETTRVDVAAMAELIDDQTIAIMGSACNYGYGTIDPIEELSDPRPGEEASASTSTAAWAASSSRGARSWAGTSPPSTSASPASPACRPTPTSTATASRAARSSPSATRPCATASTSSSPTGAGASTARRAWTAPAPAAPWPRPGRPWSRSAARGTSATPARPSSRPPTA